MKKVSVLAVLLLLAVNAYAVKTLDVKIKECAVLEDQLNESLEYVLENDQVSCAEVDKSFEIYKVLGDKKCMLLDKDIEVIWYLAKWKNECKAKSLKVIKKGVEEK